MSDAPTTYSFADLAQRGVLSFSDGYRTKQSELGASGFPVLRVGQVGDGLIEGSPSDYVRAEFATKIGSKVSQAEDIVLTTKGTFGRRVWLTQGDVGYVYSPQLCWFRVHDTDTLDPRYLYYWLGGRGFLSQASAVKSQTDMADYLSLRDLSKIRVPLPSISRQRSIGSVLGALDDKIEINRRMCLTLDEMTRDAYKAFIADCCVASEAGANLPNGWELTNLGSVVLNSDARRVPLSRRERSELAGEYPYYGAAGQIDSVSGFIFEGEYILVGEDGSVVDGDGPVVQCVWGRFWVNNHAHVLQGRGHVSNEMLYAFLRQVNIRPYITGAVQPKLNQSNLNRLPFVLPDRQTCDRYDQFARPLFARLRLCRDEDASLVQLRDALMPRLLLGELSIVDAEKFVGEVA